MNDIHHQVLSIARRAAIDVAIKASQHVMQYWPYQLNQKFNKDLVNVVYEKEGVGNVATLADKDSERMIIAAIIGEERLKDHTIVGEESDAVITGSEYAWYIDPIDGTSAFRSGLPEFGISIGLLYKNEAVLGVISRPALEQYIVAVKGEGARLFAFSGEELALLSNKVYNKESQSDRLMVGFDTSTPNRLQYLEEVSQILNSVNNMLTYGSSSAALFRLALGQLSSYIHMAPHRWDIAAAAAIIPEIGGIITNPNGGNVEWSNDQPAILASYSPEIHSQLLTLLQQHRA